MIQSLTQKAVRALKSTGHNTLVISGGVSANQRLRAKLAEVALKERFEIFYPRLDFCTDNGAMIALAGAYNFKTAQTQSLNIEVKARAMLYPSR